MKVFKVPRKKFASHLLTRSQLVWIITKPKLERFCSSIGIACRSFGYMYNFLRLTTRWYLIDLLCELTVTKCIWVTFRFSFVFFFSYLVVLPLPLILILFFSAVAYFCSTFFCGFMRSDGWSDGPLSVQMERFVWVLKCIFRKLLLWLFSLLQQLLRLTTMPLCYMKEVVSEHFRKS